MAINGKHYDWEDVQIWFNGVPLATVQEISYSDEKAGDAVYGTGSRPQTVGRGNYKASGKLVLRKPEYDLLANAAKLAGLSLFDLKLQQIIISYRGKVEDGEFVVPGGLPTVDVLRGCWFTKRDFGAKQGDQNLLVTLEFGAMELIA